MNVDIEPSWKKKLNDEFEKLYFKELLFFIQKEYEENLCFPKPENIFKAFDYSPFAETKVVLIGQDPYHGLNQAHGLCFSVQPDTRIPPSLVNIFREQKEDLGKPYPENGHLQHWAEQGVLMLNATLTVRAGKAGSHKGRGWETFTDKVIEILSRDHKHLVFMLWGGPAQKKGRKVDQSKHLVLTSGHPSPLAANRGYWFGNRHFSRANAYLKNHGRSPIEW